MARITKKLFHFNSTCEIAIANGSPYFNTSEILKKFENDLATLMLVLSDTDDYILSETTPDESFLKSLHEIGFCKPSFVSIKDLETMQANNPNLVFDMQVWGASPAEAFLLQKLNAKQPIWSEEKKELYGRHSSVELLRRYLAKENRADFISQDINSSIIEDEHAAEEYLEQHCPIVFKSPYSSSGRGLLVLRKPKLNDANRKWIRTILKQQLYIEASPWFEKQQDLSFQFNINNGVSFEGCTLFKTNANGQYQAHLLNPDFKSLAISEAELNKVGEELADVLSESEFKNYSGKLGIDAFIYTKGEKAYLHPCVEVNPRYTMGAVALAIQKTIHPKAKGSFHIHTVGELSYANFLESLQGNNTPEMQDGKLRRGVASLTPLSANARFGAYIQLN